MAEKELQKKKQGLVKRYLNRLSGLILASWKPLLIGVVVALLFRAWVVDIYGVSKHSMEPTLHADQIGSDKVAVCKLSYLFSSPDRWDLCVYQREGFGHNVVKRVVGLSGEFIKIGPEGDIFIGPDPTSLKVLRKSPGELVRLMVPIADLGRSAPTIPDGETWAFNPDHWRWEKGTMVAMPPGKGLARLKYKGMPHQGYLTPEGVSRNSGQDVRDFGVEFKCRPMGDHGEVRVLVTALDRKFSLSIKNGILAVRSDGRQIRRVNSPALENGNEAMIRFIQADLRLFLWVEGKAFTDDLEPWPPLPEGLNLVNRESSLVIEVEGGKFGLAGIRLLRDLHYSDHNGVHGTAGSPEPLGENEYFMLGDNSGMSQDSRHYGSVPSTWFVGRPVMVILPVKRMKWL